MLGQLAICPGLAWLRPGRFVTGMDASRTGVGSDAGVERAGQQIAGRLREILFLK